MGINVFTLTIFASLQHEKWMISDIGEDIRSCLGFNSKLLQCDTCATGFSAYKCFFLAELLWYEEV